MSDVVFILGAGTSKQSGAPLMANFLDVASDLLRTKAVEDKRIEFERVFEAIGGLQQVHSKAYLDLNNIESIFTVLELGRIIQRVPGLERKKIDLTISALKDLIVKTLEVTMKFPIDQGFIGVPPPYDQFASLLHHLRNNASPSLTVSVISFNYDIGVDMGLFKAGLGPDYIFERAPGVQNPIPLMKLHGSLNWAIEGNGPKIRPLHLQDYFNYFSGRFHDSQDDTRIHIGSQLQEVFLKHMASEVKPEPVIVPPSWNKADYHAALSDVWAEAARHLSEAEHIFVIGYSLPETDSFFRHLYALGSVGVAPLRRIAIYNPDDSGMVDRRFRELLGPGAMARYEYHPQTFDQAIHLIKRVFPQRTN